MGKSVMDLLNEINLLKEFSEGRMKSVPPEIAAIIDINEVDFLAQPESSRRSRVNHSVWQLSVKVSNQRRINRDFVSRTDDFGRKRTELMQTYLRWATQHEEHYANLDYHLDRSSISFGGEISFEADLPMPWVKYPPLGGIVCTFAESESGPFIACQCSKIPLRNKLRLINLENISRWEGTIDSDRWNWSVNETYWYNSDVETIDLDIFKYVTQICHQCVGILPRRYTSESRFQGYYSDISVKSHSPWWTYELQEYIRVGCELQAIFGDQVLKDQLDNEIGGLMPHALDKTKPQSYRSAYISQIGQVIENRVRAAFNLPAYGHGSQGELELYLLVKSMFPGQQIFRNLHPAWLDGLELDVYLPEISLAFEFQGQQHFQPVEHWGGEEALKKIRLRDHKKRELCKTHKVNLVHINHNDPLDREFIRYKVEKILDCN